MAIEQVKYPGLPPLPPLFVNEFAPLALVVENKCIACDRCPPVCFFDALVMVDKQGHPYGRTAIVIPENCTGCGLCFEACPVDAFVWIPDKDVRVGPLKSGKESEQDLST